MTTTEKSNNIYWYVGIIIVLIALVAIFFVFRGKDDTVDATSPTENSSPTVETRDHSTKGNLNATVEIIEYSDFQCPACAYATPVLQQIYEQYGNQIKFSYKHLPLKSIHANANAAALAAETAGAQDKFWEMHDILFNKQEQWSDLPSKDAQNRFIEYAKEIEVSNIDQFTKDLEQQTYQSNIEEDLAEAKKRDLSSTPSIFVNGVHIEKWKFENIENEILKVLEDE